MLAETLAWTLLHFLWQGVMIGCLLGLLLLLAPRDDDARRSSFRYAAAMLALLLVVLAPCLTFIWQWFGHPAIASNSDVTSQFTVLAGVDAAMHWQMPSLLQRWLLACWAAGVSWYATKMLLAWLSLQYLQRTQVHATPQWVAQQVDALMAQMSITRQVRIIISGVIQTPMTAGWLRPVIILPVNLLTGMQIDQLRLLLAHELAHIQRHDYAVNMLQNLVRILLFYHPTVHWLCRILDEERELCCDHMAIACSESKLQYAKALISLQDQPHPQPALAAASRCRHSLLRRIQRILGQPSTTFTDDLRQRPLLSLVSMLVSVTVLLAGFGGVESSTAALRALPEQQHTLSENPAIVQPHHLLDELYHKATNTRYSSAGGEADLPLAAADIKSLEPRSAVPEPQAQSVSISDLTVTRQPPDLQSLQRQHQQRQQLQRQLNIGMDTLDNMNAAAAIRSLSALQQFVGRREAVTSGLLDSDVSSAATALPEPIYQVTPEIPSRLLATDAVVIVNLVYSIAASGKPTDILVVEDSDEYRAAFADAAANALRQWQYPPPSEALQQLRIKQQFVFMQPAQAQRCITGSRICTRENYSVEQVVINSDAG